MGRRTQLQLGLLAAGVVIWGYGQREEVAWLQYTGIGFFAVATALRLAKRRRRARDADDRTDEDHDSRS